MSTTRDKHVALKYASDQQDAQHCLLYEIQMGMVDRGADLKWLSQYEHEEEILFAPLTSIEVKDINVENNIRVVDIRLNINQ